MVGEGRGKFDARGPVDKLDTRSNPSLGWNMKEVLDREHPCLAIAWSREEPDRIGEVTLLEDRRCWGAGRSRRVTSLRAPGSRSTA
jgi:hypothetical protein